MSERGVVAGTPRQVGQRIVAVRVDTRPRPAPRWARNCSTAGATTSSSAVSATSPVAPGGSGKLMVRPGAPGATGLGGAARPRVRRPLMRRHVEDPRVVPEDVLRAVAVMDVPVDDEHAFSLVHERRRRDGDVVEQAEPLAAGAGGVMPGRACQRRTQPRRRPGEVTRSRSDRSRLRAVRSRMTPPTRECRDRGRHRLPPRTARAHRRSRHRARARCRRDRQPDPFG